MSYCWGGDQEYKTTKDNLGSYGEGGVPAEALRPFRTILDAIDATRSLGLSHLWIDSLCIVQDDDEDKGREIGKMQDIYSGARVTISAACAQTCRGGFLDVVSESEFTDFAVDYPCADGSAGSVFLTKDLMNAGGRDVQPTDTRAWTFQEYYLSPRVLAFEGRKVRWRCLAGQRGDGGRDSESGFPLLSPARLAGLGRDALGREWAAAVERYSQRLLTVQSDKLPAMAGIAARFAPAPGLGRYLAGLWEGHLAEHACWATTPGNVRRTRRARRTGGGPSWSWSSVDGLIVFPRSGGAELEVVASLGLGGYERSLVSEDAPHGAVASARLTVRARAGEARWVGGGRAELEPKQDGSRAYDADFRFDVQEDSGLVASRDGRVLCLEARTYVYRVRRQQTCCSAGIVVVPAAEEGLYRRIGTFEVSHPIGKPVVEEVAPEEVRGQKLDGSSQTCNWKDVYWFSSREQEAFTLV